MALLSCDASRLSSIQSATPHLLPGLFKGWRGIVIASLHPVSPATHIIAAAAALSTSIA